MFNVAKVQKIYIAVGYSDLRRGIDGFASIIQNTFHMNPQTNALFIFCGRRSDRIKALYWDTDGYILLYKRLEGGQYQWPRTTDELKELTTAIPLAHGRAQHLPEKSDPTGPKTADLLT